MGSMTRTEARRMALKLTEEGKNLEDIGKALKAQGFVSMRTGQALSPGGVSSLISEGMGSRRKKSRTIRPGRTTSTADVIKTIAKLTSVDANTRLTLIELVSDL